MTLPPWLWRVLRSRKTRTVMKIGLCVGIAVGGGFYPLVNWWGRREFERAVAEVKAAGYPTRERSVAVEELRQSFFCQPGFSAETERAMEERWASTGEMGRATTWRIASGGMPADFSTRRAGLIEAARRAVPLADVPVDAWIEVPPGDLAPTWGLLRFLLEDAIFSRLAGDPATALESMEAYLRIGEDLMQPRARHGQKTDVRSEIAVLIQGGILSEWRHGWDDAQLAKLDGILAGEDFPALRLGHFRELPAECIHLHQEILSGRVPGPRPSAEGLFALWTWDPSEIRRRAGVLWDAWKPNGFYEAEMARSLVEARRVADSPSEAKLRELHGSAKSNFLISRLFEPGRIGDVLLKWHSHSECEVRIILARHLIATERYRLRHGGLPGRLEDLDADLRKGLPVDLVTGKPLKYEGDPEIDVFRLWFMSPEKPGEWRMRRFPEVFGF